MNPFFIIGAPRSGTTMLRDILKNIPDLYSPEETHFYRWAAPFGGPEFTSYYKNNKTLKLHREMDGITDEQFFEMYDSSLSRSDFSDKYSEMVCEVKGKKFWFDKTPQNVYSLPLISAQYPSSKIIHIYRNPYAVIKSLVVGKVIHVPQLIGAANYWNETMDIISVCKPFLGDRLIEICYEDLVLASTDELGKLEKGLNLDFSDVELGHMKARDVDYSKEFDSDDLDKIAAICSKNMKLYDYKVL